MCEQPSLRHVGRTVSRPQTPIPKCRLPKRGQCSTHFFPCFAQKGQEPPDPAPCGQQSMRQTTESDASRVCTWQRERRAVGSTHQQGQHFGRHRCPVRSPSLLLGSGQSTGLSVAACSTWAVLDNRIICNPKYPRRGQAHLTNTKNNITTNTTAQQHNVPKHTQAHAAAKTLAKQRGHTRNPAKRPLARNQGQSFGVFGGEACKGSLEGQLGNLTYESLGFGAMDVTKPYEFYNVWGHGCYQTL